MSIKNSVVYRQQQGRGNSALFFCTNGNLVSITTTSINNDEQAEIPEEVVTYTLTKEYENSTLKMSKEYTLDTDSGDTSETVVTYNADETVSSERVTTVTKEENAADKTDSETISYTYDSFGNVISQQSTAVDSENTETVSALVYTYDKLDRNVEIAKATGETQQEYMYNPLGDVIYEKSNSSETRTIYDDYSRVVQEITQEDYKSDLDGLKNDTASDTYSDASAGHTYTYADNGNLASETNRLGVTTDYTYYSTGEKKTEAFDIYKYDYNVKGNLTKVYVDGVNTLSYNYDENYNLTSEVYANGQSIRYEYDDNGNLIRQYHNNDTVPYVTYTYSEDNELTEKVNTDTGLKYVHGENNSVSVYKTSDNTLVQSYTETETEVDEENGIEAQTDITETHFGTIYSSVIKTNTVSYSTGNNTVNYSYTGTDSNSITSNLIKFNNATVISSNYEYDINNNITSKVLSFNASVSVKNTYDNEGRIITTGYDEPQIYYTYDDKSQIVRSDNSVLDYSTIFTYDDRGNILSKNKYAYTRDENISTSPIESTTFTYSNDGWNDKLTSVNGIDLTYDANGNVLTYGDREYTWNSGRNLESIVDSENEYSYTYDENGIRTSKTVNGITTYYNTKDGIILSQTDGTNTIYFQYDTSGVPFGFIYNETQYFYLTNQMGDVISITDAQGNELAQYEYDEWGSVAVVYTTHNSDYENFLANINPLRYRGYYYDNETGYYYLQSRYYDASVCRFINADDHNYIDIKNFNGSNFFIYCSNNPIINADYSGQKGCVVKFRNIFILYDSKSFSQQASDIRGWYRKYDKLTIVKLFAINSKRKFIYTWNEEIYNNPVVYLVFHGSPYHIYPGENFLCEDVNKLRNLNIKEIRIYACNCGHQDVKNNFAKAMRKRITKAKTILAMDGSISYYFPIIKEKGPFIIRLSKDQKAFNKYRKKNSWRKPSGLIFI